MAFNTNKSSASTKTDLQFAVMLRSNKTDKAIGWFNMVNEFSLAIFGVKPQEVTYQMACAKLPAVLDNAMVHAVITDSTLEKEQAVVDASEY